MSEKNGPRQRLKRLVSRLGSNSRPPRDRTLDPGEGPSDAATSTTTSVINLSPSPAAVTPGGNQSLGEASTRAPTTAAQSVLPRSRFGLFQLTNALSEEELRQGGVDIVAIHGITGDYEKTWTHPEGALWLKDFLPNDLSVLTRVFSFGYDSQIKFSVSKARLDDFARSLLQALNRNLQSRALVFICHSMGGLVIKQALVIARLDSNLYPGVQGSTKGIIFLSTPHRGSGSTDLPISLGKALNALLTFTPSSVGSTRTDLLETLKSNSDELKRLATDFRNQAVGIKMVSCYEMNITPPLKALIVDKQTGTLDFPGEVHIPMEGCNHNEVCRFSAHGDFNYQNVLAELQNLVDECVPKVHDFVVDEVNKDANPEKMYPELPVSTDAFYGRDIELRKMKELLDPGKPGQKGVVLCGIGGSGKTQTTLRFIMNHKELYSAFIWINGLTIEHTKQSFSEAADTIASNWPSRDLPITYTGSVNWKRVITRLRTTRYSRWLLIIDSVDNLNLEDYRRYIPSCNHGSIIVTSTQIQASEVFRMPKLDIDSLDLQSSRKLLIGRVFGPAKTVDLSNANHQFATSIVKELNGSPLAIEQAAVLLRKKVVSFSSFVSDYRAQYSTLMDQYPPRGYLSYDKERPITAVFSMLYQFIRTEKLEAAILLTFIAILGPWQIPISFIENFQFGETQENAPIDGDTNALKKTLGDRIAFRLALDYLADVCLVKVKYDGELSWKSFSVHRAISHWCVEVMTSEKRAWIVQAAYRLAIGILVPIEGPDQWFNKEKVIMRAYIAPLDRCISLIQNHIPKDEIRPPSGRFCQDFTTITAQLAQVYLLESRLEEAKVHFSTAIEYETIRQADEWPKTERVLDLLCGLADVLHRLGDLESSAELYSSAIPLSEKLFGHVDERTVAISSRFKSLSDRREVMLAHHKAAVIGATDRKLLENAQRTQAVTNIQESATAEAGPSNELVSEDVGAELRGAAYAGDEGMVRLILGIQTINPNSADVQNRTALFWAVLGGHENVVKLLLATNQVDINSKDNYKRTPLSLAAENGRENVVKLLLATSQVDVNSKNNYGRTPLSLAAENGHESVVKLLLATGQINVNSIDIEGWTPLLCAAEKGHKSIVKLLLATGQVDVNSNDSWMTPLFLAAKNGHESVVKLLLATGQVEVNSTDSRGWTPLWWAAKNGHENVVKLLLATGQVEVNSTDSRGWTPLSLAAENGHEIVVKLLLATSQVDVNSNDNKSWTPLSWAAKNGHESVVKLLLATNQVDIDPKNNYGRTPLSLAARNGHKSVVKLLLATGQVNVNSTDSGGRTPLLHAAESGREDVVKLLLATNQVDIDLKNNYKRTPLSLAAENGHESVVKLLLATGQVNVNSTDSAGWAPLWWAARNGHESVVKLLLATSQVDVNSKSNYGGTPLSLAAENGHESVVKLLLATGQVNVNSTDSAGWAPLWWAARNGHESVVKLLLATSQVDVNSKSNYGGTPLSLAAENGHESVVKLLLATSQVDVNSKSNYGGTPLSLAAENGHESVVKLLLATGQVNVNSTDSGGWTPLLHAAKSGRENVVKLLLATGQANIDSKNNFGGTPLWWAIKNGHEGVAKLLLATGRVNVNSKGNGGLDTAVVGKTK